MGTVAATHLIGRSRELRWLLDRLDDGEAGRGIIVVLSGEAGIGKSRLARALRHIAGTRGWRSATAWCPEEDRTVPLAVVQELLAQAAHDDLASEPDPGRDWPGGPGRREVAALVAAARDGPRLLVVEDVQWCDEGSWSVLGQLAHRLRDLPALLLLTLRTGAPSTLADRHVGALLALAHAEELPLAALTPADTAGLARQLTDAPLSPAFLCRLHDLTDGSPLFVTEVVAGLRDRAALGQQGAAALDRVTIPRSVQAAIHNRTSRLTPAARGLLEVAAVLGRRVRDDLLLATAGLTAEEALPLVEELVLEGVLEEEGEEVLAFHHELIRRGVASDLLLRRRRRIHLAALEALGEDTGDPRRDAELTRHAAGAGANERVLQHAVRAGERALDLGAPLAALELFDLAVAASEALDRPPALPVLRGRGRARELLGEVEAARGDLEAALAMVRGQGNPVEEHVGALLDLGWWWSGRDFAVAGDHFRRALALVRSDGAPDLQVSTLNRVGNWHLNCDRPEQARALHTEALQIAGAHHDPAGAARSVDLLGTVQLTALDVGAAAASYAAAIRDFRHLGDKQGLASALGMRAFCGPQYLNGCTAVALTRDEALADAEDSRRLAESMGWTVGRAHAHVAAAAVQGFVGDLDAAERSAERGLALATEAEHPYIEVEARIVLGAVHLDACALPLARTHLDAALEIAEGIGSAYWTPVVVGLLVRALEPADAHAPADRSVHQAPAERAVGQAGADRSADQALADRAAHLVAHVALSAGAPQTMGQRWALLAHGHALLLAGDPRAAGRLLDRAADGWANASLTLARGRARQALGDVEGAHRLWLGLCRPDEGIPPAISWRAHALLAEDLRSAGRPVEATGHLLAARRTLAGLAERTRSGHLHRALADRLDRLPEPTADQVDRHRFGGLTRRQQEIAALVADGLTNSEIADHLVISPRTVEKHIEHVLSAIGASSRTQVAVWAREVGLVG